MFGNYLNLVNMYIYLLLGFIVAAANAGPSGRIINGDDVTIQQYPYQASVQSFLGRHLCGGSLISANFVVTAAHCVWKKSSSQLKVRIGSTYWNRGGQVIGALAIKYHQNYTSEKKMYDIAVIKLQFGMSESSVIRYIGLAETTPSDGVHAVVTGWGITCPDCEYAAQVLQKIDVEIISKTLCATDYNFSPGKIQDTMICAYSPGQDACTGDSGGPLVVNNELVGVVSFGHQCAINGYPGVYANVVDLRDWILEAVDSL